MYNEYILLRSIAVSIFERSESDYNDTKEIKVIPIGTIATSRDGYNYEIDGWLIRERDIVSCPDLFALRQSTREREGKNDTN